MNIEHYGQNAVVETNDVVFSFEVSENPRDFDKTRKIDSEDSLNWSTANTQYHIDKWRILPFGDNNDLPLVIKNVVQNNSKVPGILQKKTGMLWGKGPKLYKEGFDSEFNLVREWQSDDEIETWLDSWNAEEYLHKCVVDFNHIQGSFSKFYLNRGSRIGEKRTITKLEHVSPARARQACALESLNPDPTHVVVTDWVFSHIDHLTKFKVYPIFDFNKPFAFANSILYSNMYSFCTDYYTVPDIYGSLEWIRRSTAVPLILKALSKNSINAKYHITSPQSFWDQKREIIQENCCVKQVDYKESMLQEYMNEYLRKVAKVLSGDQNSGKFWHTVDSVFVDGTNLLEQGWSIKPIDQNIKDFCDTQIKIDETADRSASAGAGVHSSIAGTGKDGHSDSGSEQLYALQNYMLTGIDLSEMIVLKAINYAIKANFPKKKLKLGFYHLAPVREQDKTSKDRVTKQQP